MSAAPDLTVPTVDPIERQRQTFVTELRHHVDHLHRQVAAWEPAPCPKR